MHVPMRARAPRLLMLLALGGLTACQAAAGTSLPKARPAAPEAAPVTTAPAAPEQPAPAPSPPAPAPPTLGPLARRLPPDLIVHGPGVGPSELQQVSGLVPAGQS